MTRIEFEKRWLETFAPNLTKEQYNRCYVYQYLWHIFSYEVIPKCKVMIGDLARKAYEKVDKDNAIVIQLAPFERNEQTSLISENAKNWKEIDIIPEFYVVDKDWKWTYVSTHENDCQGLGPYFYKIN